MSNDLPQQLRAVALRLGWKHPAFGIATVHLTYRETTELPTAAITADGHTLWNREFFESLSPEEREFVLAHELCHLLLQHSARRGSRDPDVWGIATDMAINHGLIEAGVGQCPSHGLRPLDAWKTWSAEEIYDVLSRQQPPPTNSGAATAGCGALPSASPKNEEWERRWHEARAQAQHIGALMGDTALQRLLELPPAKIDWRAVLRRSVSLAIAHCGHEATSFSRRGRRSAPVGPQFPGWVGTQPRVALCVDSSGSMFDSVAQVLAEVAALVRKSNIAIFAVVHDADIQWQGWFRPNEKPTALQDAIARGFGGTDASTAYQAIEAAGSFEVFIHLTDCYLHWPPQPRRCRKYIVGRVNSQEDAPATARVYDVYVEGASHE